MKNPGTAATASGATSVETRKKSLSKSNLRGPSEASRKNNAYSFSEAENLYSGVRHAGLPTGMTRLVFLNFIKTAQGLLGLTAGDIKYLECAILATFDEDWQPGRACAFWLTINQIALRTGLHPRQILRIEKKLMTLGLIVNSCTERQKRSGSRKEGRIQAEAGINLAPLVEQAGMIKELAEQAAYEKSQVQPLQWHINRLFAHIRMLSCEDLTRAADEILPSHRPSQIRSYAKLKATVDALEAVLADFSDDASGDKCHSRGDIGPAPHTKDKKTDKICTAQKRPEPKPLRTSPVQAYQLATPALRDSIEFYASAQSPGQPLGWGTIVQAARDYAQTVGIRRDDWQRSIDLLGEERTALCLVIVDQNALRTDRYKVGSIPSAFVGMGRKEARTNAVLANFIGELTAFLRRAGHV